MMGPKGCFNHPILYQATELKKLYPATWNILLSKLFDQVGLTRASDEALFMINIINSFSYRLIIINPILSSWKISIFVKRYEQIS